MNDDLSQIRKDIASFADPHSGIEISSRGASWVQNKKNIEIQFIRGEGLPDIKYNDYNYTYKQFFASEYMADLIGLAESIAAILKEPSNYVSAPALDEDQVNIEKADKLLEKSAHYELPYGSTRIVMVKGDAGAGKTYTLKYLASSSAVKYALNDSDFLYFYIDAQGRALSRLDEAVALILQDLRAKFTYMALLTLTRLGLIVPIIDGFDELLGTGGYGDAFDSLGKFLARIDGEGSIIASARSSFFNYEKFIESSSKYEYLGTPNFDIRQISIEKWGDEQVIEYLGKPDFLKMFPNPQTELDRLKVRLGQSGLKFLYTPFFLTTLINIKSEGEEIKKGKRIISQVIDHFIERERKKLLDKSQNPILSMHAHNKFLELLSEEMWWQETRELDPSTIKIIAELVAEENNLNEINKVIFVERSPTYSFFSTKNFEGHPKTSFNHEYFFSYFFSRFLAKVINDKNDDMNRTLTRAKMSSVLGEEFGHAIIDLQINPSIILSNLSERNIPQLTRETNRENSGVLIFGVFKASDKLEGVSASNSSFLSLDMSGLHLTNGKFDNCEFTSCSFIGTTFQNTQYSNVVLIDPLVNIESTRFGGINLEYGKTFYGLRIQKKPEIASIYDLEEIEPICKKIEIILGAVPEAPKKSIKSKQIADVLRKLIKVSSRLFYLSDDDLRIKNLSNLQYWDILEKKLFELGIFTEKAIHGRGQGKIVRKFTVLPDVIQKGETLRSENPSIVKLWNWINAQ